MLKLILEFIISIGVGIYGYFVPSYINMSVLQLGTLRSTKSLYKVLVVISLIEIPYCFFCMSMMQWILQQHILLLVIKWLIVVILLFLAGLNLFETKKKSKHTPLENVNVMEKKQVNKLLLLAIFNPFQLSAWAIWGTYLIEKSWFEWSAFSIFIFSIGASIGVAIILWIYAFMGNKLVSYFSVNKKQIDYFVSALLIILAVVQLVRNLS